MGAVVYTVSLSEEATVEGLLHLAAAQISEDLHLEPELCERCLELVDDETGERFSNGDKGPLSGTGLCAGSSLAASVDMTMTEIARLLLAQRGLQYSDYSGAADSHKPQEWWFCGSAMCLTSTVSTPIHVGLLIDATYYDDPEENISLTDGGSCGSLLHDQAESPDCFAMLLQLFRFSTPSLWYLVAYGQPGSSFSTPALRAPSGRTLHT